MKKLIILFALLFGLFACANVDDEGTSQSWSEAGGESGDDADGAAPIISDDTLTAGTVSSSTVIISWTAADDDTTAPAELKYLVYYSTSDNLSTVADAETNGTAVGTAEANIITKSVSGLTASTSYYFVVVVTDSAGNKSIYSTLTQATVAEDRHDWDFGIWDQSIWGD